MSMHVFDRRAVRRHRDRAAARLDAHDFLFREVANRLADRLEDVARRFPLGLDLGCHGGEIAAALNGHDRIGRLIGCDLSEGMARRARTNAPAMATICGDEESLPFRAQSLDCVISNLSLHWVNDLPGALLQIRRALKPDGLFLATAFGTGTLAELRDSLAAAETELENGLSPRISPFMDVRDAGGLLQRAGFALPVVDMDEIEVSYADPFGLLADLRGMGETNAVLERRKSFSRKATLMSAIARYARDRAGPDGRLPAHFNVVFMTAWAPGDNQPQPAPRGSGTQSLATVLGSNDATGDDSG